MGLFSSLFKPRPKAACETPIGLFTLTYSKGNNNLWSTNSGEVLLSVKGSATQPDVNQLKFLETYQAEIDKLDARITRRFIDEFEEAGIPADFIAWNERFKIVAIEVMLLFNHEAYWNITFEELKTPYTHFTLYIEGERLTDFSIDT